jgi:hypothetical protein
MYQGLPSGRLPYAGLGDWLSDLDKAAEKLHSAVQQAQAVAEKTHEVQSGQSSVAVIPKGQSTFTIPVPGQSYSATVPILPVALGIGGLLLLLALRRR